MTGDVTSPGGGALSQRGAYDEAAEEDTEPPLHCQAVDDVMI